MRQFASATQAAIASCSLHRANTSGRPGRDAVVRAESLPRALAAQQTGQSATAVDDSQAATATLVHLPRDDGQVVVYSDDAVTEAPKQPDRLLRRSTGQVLALDDGDEHAVLGNQQRVHVVVR